MQPELATASSESLISYQTQEHSEDYNVLSETFDQTWHIMFILW